MAIKDNNTTKRIFNTAFATFVIVPDSKDYINFFTIRFTGSLFLKVYTLFSQNTVATHRKHVSL